MTTGWFWGYMGCVIIVLEEFKSKRIDTVSKALIVFCKAFEDNLGALELVKSPKFFDSIDIYSIRLCYFSQSIFFIKKWYYSIFCNSQYFKELYFTDTF